MDNPPLPKHVFISYSSKDKAEVDIIRSFLDRQKIPYWQDSRLQPGDENYDAEIREAIQQSFAFVLIATPQSAASKFVTGEIRLAQRREIPIIPLWIDGEYWEDSIYTELITMQYIDFRSVIRDFLEDTLQHHGLVNRLYDIIDGVFPKSLLFSVPAAYSDENSIFESFPRIDHGIAASFYTVFRHQDSILALRLRSYPTLLSMIDEIYQQFLQVKIPPAYGQNWFIARELDEDIYQLLVPWEWQNKPFVPVATFASDWLQLPISASPVITNTLWWVLEADAIRDRVQFCVAADTQERFTKLMLDLSAMRMRYSLIEMIYDATTTEGRQSHWAQIDVLSPPDVDPEKYPYRSVFILKNRWSQNMTTFQGKVVVFSDPGTRN